MTYISQHANGPILRKETDVKLLNRADRLPIQHGRGAGKLKKKDWRSKGLGHLSVIGGGGGSGEGYILFAWGKDGVETIFGGGVPLPLPDMVNDIEK